MALHQLLNKTPYKICKSLYIMLFVVAICKRQPNISRALLYLELIDDGRSGNSQRNKSNLKGNTTQG